MVFDSTTGYARDYFAGQWYNRNEFREGITVNGSISTGSNNIVTITGDTAGLSSPGSANIDLGNSSITFYGASTGGIFDNTLIQATGGTFKATYNTSGFPGVGTPMYMEMSTTGLHGDSGTSSITDSFSLNNNVTSNATPGHVWRAGQLGGT